MDIKRSFDLGVRAFRELTRRKGAARALSAGDPAPDFDLPDHRGGRVRSADLRGRWVVMWFYPAADTPG